MAEVEDVAGPSGRGVEDAPDSRADLTEAGKEHRRVEIALHRHVVPQLVPRGAQLDPPVETHDVAARVLHQREKRGRAHTDVNDGDIGGERGTASAAMW